MNGADERDDERSEKIRQLYYQHQRQRGELAERQMKELGRLQEAWASERQALEQQQRYELAALHRELGFQLGPAMAAALEHRPRPGGKGGNDARPKR